MSLKAVPVSLKEANAFVAEYHRHNKPVAGHKFSVGCSDGVNLVGVAIVGRPIARKLDDGFTTEVLRVCAAPNAPKGTNSFLYARCWNAWKELGGQRIVTYTLTEETGSSLRGAGWVVTRESAAVTGKGWTNRAGRDWQPVYGQAKLRWEPKPVDIPPGSGTVTP